MLLAEDELDCTLEEPGATDEGTDELLGATLGRTLLDELCVVPKWVARRDVARMPLVLLTRKSPQVLRDAAFQLFTMSKFTQQLPLPDQLQPI